MNKLPEFDTDHLQALGRALLARSKALKRKFAHVDISRTLDSGSIDYEVAEIAFRKKPSPKSMTIRLKVWSDRWVWVDAREMAKSGWKWSFNTDGRISGSKEWSYIIECVEMTETFFSSDVIQSDKDKVFELWNSALVRGPTGSVDRSGFRA